jgi:hypothetical protein
MSESCFCVLVHDSLYHDRKPRSNQRKKPATMWGNYVARATRTLKGCSWRTTSRRCLSTNGANGDTSWRRQQLEKLESRFQHQNHPADVIEVVNKDDELQSHWKAMEGRVVRRKPISKESAAGKVGRRNIRRTDEEIWEQNGVYDDDKTT